MTWQHPPVLWALLGLVPLAVAYGVHYSRARRVQRHYGLRSSVSALAMARLVMRLLAFALVVVGLAGPIVPVQEGRTAAPLEVMFLLDASQSMEVKDVGSTTRLQAAKRLISRTSSGLRGHKLGLVGFADFAYTYVPFTIDYQAFANLLEDVETNQFSSGRTNMRYGLGTALTHFWGNDTVVEIRPGRVLVVLTDGETQEPAYTSLVERVKGLEVRLIPVAVGTTGGGPVPLPEGNGYYQEEGKQVRSRVNLAKLDSLARNFGTPVYRLDGEGSAAVLAQQLTKAIQNSPRHYPDGELKTHNLYHLPLAAAALCLLLAMVLKPRQKTA